MLRDANGVFASQAPTQSRGNGISVTESTLLPPRLATTLLRASEHALNLNGLPPIVKPMVFVASSVVDKLDRQQDDVTCTRRCQVSSANRM